ncbi:competence protein ComF [Pseudoxanthomonas dokdonensis]|uniref:Competence protein ComF n=1 Tax=Pseudoxanthomonas dokdonensis TaxID=344882 RepID=A0A0R0CG78_9GAMM|nr:competence protein ComF [Pseudoxanthomonas dokdonensis]
MAKVDKYVGWVSRWLFAPRCIICSERGDNSIDLCQKCRLQLLDNRSACQRCGLPLLAGDRLCGDCLQRPSALTEVHAAYQYGFPLDRLIPRFKFHRDLVAGKVLAQLMVQGLQALPSPPLLVPVPLHPARLRQRGYDQALELARALARQRSIPLRGDLLRRTRDTAPQSELDAAARKRNLRSAFAAPSSGRLPAHVVLIDDVMTTGATLQSAARCLRRAGVERVDAWICARVI